MSAPNRKINAGRIVLFGIVALVGIVTSYVIVSWNASISGSEFCPNNFQVRTFSYSRIPLTRIRISQTVLGTPTSSAAIDVLRHVPTLSTPPVWQVISINGLSDESEGPLVLETALKERDANGHNFWGAWSKANPNSAAVLWPMVQQIAFQEMYWVVPELLEEAEVQVDPTKLKQQLVRIVARAVLEVCRDHPAGKSKERRQFLRDWLGLLPGANSLDFVAETQKSIDELP